MNRSYPALRGIAILLVIVNHTIHMAVQYAAEAGPLDKTAPIFQALAAVQGLGVLAVPIFLFLSGCFFAYAAGQGDLRHNYRVVWVNLRHVVAPYLIWSLVFYAEILVFHGQRYSPLGYVKNLLVGYPFNFVPLLAFYYLISPLLIRLMRKVGWWVALVIGVYQLVLLAVSHPGVLGFETPAALRWMFPPVVGGTLGEWAIYFPLGLLVVLSGAPAVERLHRMRWTLVGLTVALFVLSVLDAGEWIELPLAARLVALPFILLAPLFQRNRFPMVRRLELVGKRAYGLYLTNLLTLDLALLAIQALAPGVLPYYGLLVLPLMAVALFVPYFGMSGLERLLKPGTFRYAFG